jgi:GTP pyrophosphokinase
MPNENPLKQYKKEIGTTNGRVISALKLAQEKHKGLYRKSGEAYIEHCIAVYNIIKDWGVEDPNLLIAALLHDTVEDTDLKITEIESKFGKEVSFLVNAVTEIKFGDKQNRDFKTLKKIVGTSYIDPKVSVLKLADRYHNLTTLQYVPNLNRKIKAKESLEIYAKLAESLGMWVVKNKIEDMSFQYLRFDAFSKVKTSVDTDKRLSKSEISKNLKIIRKALEKKGIKADIETKIGGYYSIYKKLKSNAIKGIASSDDYQKINDVISYRVRVKTVEECYGAVYSIHDEFGNKIDFTRFDEFIGANKRINGYQALQTTVKTNFGSVEIAIVTDDMENFNNWGYIYNLQKGIKNTDYNLNLIFTPAKDLLFLPEKSRAIDFAYTVNQKLGDEATKVIVNGKEKKLDYVLKNADTVEVLTGERTKEEDIKLSQNCLPQTKDFIEKKIIERERTDAIKTGRKIFEERVSPRGIIDLEDIGPNIHNICYALGCDNVNELYYRISNDYIDIEKLDDLLNEYQITKSKLKWTTLEMHGTDKPGILNVITNSIAKNNGNIIRIAFDKDKSSETFYLRILIENVNTEKLKRDLAKNNNFKNLKIV